MIIKRNGTDSLKVTFVSKLGVEFSNGLYLVVVLRPCVISEILVLVTFTETGIVDFERLI